MVLILKNYNYFVVREADMNVIIFKIMNWYHLNYLAGDYDAENTADLLCLIISILLLFDNSTTIFGPYIMDFDSN